MQTFQDTETGQYWQFDDDVVQRGGRFFSPHDPMRPLDVPATLVPATLPPPPDPSLEDLREQKLAEINAAFDDAAAALVSGYPEAERLTWPVQQAEALAWEADPDAPTPYLDELAAAREVAPEEMRALTLAAVRAFLAASPGLVGKRQRLRDAALAAPDPETLDSINW